MKVTDINPEIFKLFPEIIQTSYLKRGEVDSSVLMRLFDPASVDYDPALLKPSQKKAIINAIIEGFPDLTGKTQKEQGQEFGYWRHSCHISDGFEYDINQHNARNYLLNKQNIEYALQLADFLAKKTAEVGDAYAINSMERVIAGFMVYNWDQLKENGLDAPLVMPKSFRSPQFANLPFVDSSYGENSFITSKEIQTFLNATTLRDWIERYAEVDTEKQGIPTPISTSEWKDILKKYPDAKIQNCVMPSNSHNSLAQVEKFQKVLREHPKGEVSGIWVDIDGTLFDDEGNFREGLYETLVAISKYEKVTIFTGGDIKKQTERLKKAGVDTEKFPVVPKEDYRGYLFTGFIIDDDSPENQGFILRNPKTRHFNLPDAEDICLDEEYLDKIVFQKEDLTDILEEERLRIHYVKLRTLALNTMNKNDLVNALMATMSLETHTVEMMTKLRSRLREELKRNHPNQSSQKSSQSGDIKGLFSHILGLGGNGGNDGPGGR
ncbi:MAG: hypothetical protein J6Y85_04350 [Alphaproteobacteria bacterium]|nr:hypothetical protein [Alphaproteobacteria bacterium]